MVHFHSKNFAALFLFFQGKVTFVILLLLHSLVAGSLVHVGAFDFFVGGKNLILGRFFSLLRFLVLIITIGAFGCRCSGTRRPAGPETPCQYQF